MHRVVGKASITDFFLIWMFHHIKCRIFVSDNTVEGLDEDFLYHTFLDVWSGTLLVSIELVVALPNHAAVLVGGVPDLGSEEKAAVTADQLRGEYGL